MQKIELIVTRTNTKIAKLYGSHEIKFLHIERIKRCSKIYGNLSSHRLKYLSGSFACEFLSYIFHLLETVFVAF